MPLASHKVEYLEQTYILGVGDPLLLHFAQVTAK